MDFQTDKFSFTTFFWHEWTLRKKLEYICGFFRTISLIIIKEWGIQIRIIADICSYLIIPTRRRKYNTNHFKNKTGINHVNQRDDEGHDKWQIRNWNSIESCDVFDTSSARRYICIPWMFFLFARKLFLPTIIYVGLEMSIVNLRVRYAGAITVI